MCMARRCGCASKTSLDSRWSSGSRPSSSPENVKHVYKGEGGYNADNEFFDSMADI